MSADTELYVAAKIQAKIEKIILGTIVQLSLPRFSLEHNIQVDLNNGVIIRVESVQMNRGEEFSYDEFLLPAVLRSVGLRHRERDKPRVPRQQQSLTGDTTTTTALTSSPFALRQKTKWHEASN